jgi:hypothetical protein
MNCEERARLERQVADTEAAHQAARRSISEKIGVSSREEFRDLAAAVERARIAHEKARHLLKQHIQTHGCARLGESSAHAENGG